ncbi:MAG: hypothetical protein AB7U83_05105 [Vicinamibacterales bacterium]
MPASLQEHPGSTVEPAKRADYDAAPPHVNRFFLVDNPDAWNECDHRPGAPGPASVTRRR